MRQYKTDKDNMKTAKDTDVNENVGFRQIREVKPSRKTYSRVQRYLSIEQENGRDMKISEAAVELIEAGLETKGIN
jgi:hypothetical protein